MGEAELIKASRTIVIKSVLIFYGDAASADLTEQIADDTQCHWNEPRAEVIIDDQLYGVLFDIQGKYMPDLEPEAVWYNDDPTLNFFRIEEYVEGNISFVDAIGCNTGYYKLENLLQTSTTAAHEYGHTLGLVHPKVLDVRGISVPRIMYPRGTICDPAYQYDPLAEINAPGGCLNPVYRRVLQEDIDELNLQKLDFNNKNKAVVGEFTSLYHAKHKVPSFQ